MVQSPIENDGTVIDPDVSEGRFIAFFPAQRLDPAIYERGRVMTIGGTLTGTITGKIAGKEYTFPVMEVAESQLWKDEPFFYTEHRYWYGAPFEWSRKGMYVPYY